MSLARQFFREMRPFFRMLDDVPLARPPPSLFPMMPHFEHFQDTSNRPALDLSDKGDKFIVEADLPGIPKENVNIRIGEDGQTITIEGKIEERRGLTSTTKTSTADGESTEEGTITSKATDTSTTVAEKSAEPPTQISSERPFTRSMSFARTVWLPRPVDTDNVSASMKDGVLTITVKKAEDKVGKVVHID